MANSSKPIHTSPGHPPRRGEEEIAPNPDAIADAVTRLMGDPGLGRRIAGNARAQIAGMTWRATALKTIDVYRSAMAARARA